VVNIVFSILDYLKKHFLYVPIRNARLIFFLKKLLTDNAYYHNIRPSYYQVIIGCGMILLLMAQKAND